MTKSIATRIVVVLILLAVPVGFLFAGGRAEAPADDALPVVGISTGSSGTSWRNIMIDGLEEVGDQMVEAGRIDSYRLVNNVTNGDATEQANILRNFISQGVDIILVNPNSPTALNGVIAEAQDEGILVMAFDATVTAPDVINVTLDHYAWMRKNIEYIVSVVDSGNAIQIYGLDGHPANNDRVQAVDDVLAENPGINLVANTSGSWDQTVAKDVTAQILGGGQQIDIAITQDGMAFGVLSAFQDAGRLPRIMFGDPGTAFFREWKALRDAGADFQAVAQPNPPGIGGTAFKIVMELYEGRQFKPGVLDGNTYFYQVAMLVTDDNFEEGWALLEGQPDDYLLTEIMEDSVVDSLFQ
jgi:ribose transport system substrate-binding protein